MKTLTIKIAMSLALGLAAGVPLASIAADGPNLATLVPIDENRFDMNNKVSKDKSDVLNRLTKDSFYREIFEVKEKQATPQTAFIVRESKKIARQTFDEDEIYVRVNKAQVGPAWAYQNR